MSTHTPGPWAGPYRHVDGQDCILSPSETASDAVVAWLDRWTGPHADEQAANARLIAAAPDLLAALAALLRVCDEELDPKRTPEMAAARAAIARAGA